MSSIPYRNRAFRPCYDIERISCEWETCGTDLQYEFTVSFPKHTKTALPLFFVSMVTCSFPTVNDRKMFLSTQLTFIDMIMYVIFHEADLKAHAIRWTRVLRPLFLINLSEGRQVSTQHWIVRWEGDNSRYGLPSARQIKAPLEPM